MPAARRSIDPLGLVGSQATDALRSSSGSASERISSSVLWIDDQVEPGDSSVRVLTSEGFRVDCAASGAKGLSMASSRAYGVIILDLRLPDTSGLALLRSLRASGVSTPVLVLTGFGDLESAVAALRLGVIDFLRKPLIGDELVAAVRTVADACAEPAGAFAPREPPEPAPPDERETDAARTLLARLDEIAETAEEGPATTARLATALLLAIESGVLHISTFLASAEGLRHALTTIDPSAPRALVVQVRDMIERARTKPAIDHRTVRTALGRMEVAVSRGVRLTQNELARELGVDPAHLGRLIRSRTGRGFRQWRSALSIRLAVRGLADDETQIAQIAFRAGYEHPSQLDREFRRVFAVSPREYRRLRRALLRFTP